MAELLMETSVLLVLLVLKSVAVEDKHSFQDMIVYVQLGLEWSGVILQIIFDTQSKPL